MAAGFRANVWDPVLILSQIATMQCHFYFVFGMWLITFDWLADYRCSVSQFFSAKAVVNWQRGWPVISAYAANSISGALGLWKIIKRSKQCLDFTVTMYIIHFVVCSVYGGVPSHWQWWLTNVSCALVCVLLGEFVCRRSELSIIPLTSSLGGGETSERRT